MAAVTDLDVVEANLILVLESPEQEVDKEGEGNDVEDDQNDREDHVRDVLVREAHHVGRRSKAVRPVARVKAGGQTHRGLNGREGKGKGEGFEVHTDTGKGANESDCHLVTFDIDE